MINFKTDPELGPTVSNWGITCFGAYPIKSLEELAFYAGARKFSQLCGFRFHSAMPNNEYPDFFVSFVCKPQSKIFRKSPNLSKWYIFKKINKDRYDVLDKKIAFMNYGFDVDKFYNSNVFSACVKKFKEYIKKGLDVEAPALLKSLKDDVAGQNEYKWYIKSIMASLPYIDGEGTNSEYYKLINLDAGKAKR